MHTLTHRPTPRHVLTSTATVESAAPRRILVADHNSLVRYALRSLLDVQFNAVTDEANKPEEALRMLGQGRWHLFVLDPSLPGPSWLEVMSNAIEVQPRVPILVFATHPDPQAARRALRLGAMGYVSKSVSMPELAQAIRALLDGRRFLSSETMQSGTVATSDERPVREILSQRELFVMQRLIAGKSISDISAELSISAKSVSTYRARTLCKLGLDTNMDLMRYALQHHLV